MSAAGPLLEVIDVSLDFGGVHALHGVRFSVHRRDVFSIIGPNGAGKTSMLNAISGVYRPTRGQIRLEGADRTRAGQQTLARLGVARTFQNVALFKGMSVLDNILAGRHLAMRCGFLAAGFRSPRWRREEAAHRAAVERLIELLEIRDLVDRAADSLAYGLRKRVELGRALAMEPKLLLLDEPMAGMSGEEKADMVRFILEANRALGTTVILIEHDMGVVMDISHRVLVLDHGETIAEGTPAEVRSNAAVIRAYLGEGD
jgi:branched-chain amino acid transport system ATP-binding protein